MAEDTTVHIVALSSQERADQARACYALGFHAEIYSNYEELVAAAPRRGLVVAQDIAERGGIGELVDRMGAGGFWLPVIATAPAPDPHRIVQAVKGGALDYLASPFDTGMLATALRRALDEAQLLGTARRQAVAAQARLATLTGRESEVLDLLVAGASNKMIARTLQISPRTVEIHRANMMAKLDAHHAADAVRLRLEAAMGAGRSALSLAVPKVA